MDYSCCYDDTYVTQCKEAPPLDLNGAEFIYLYRYIPKCSNLSNFNAIVGYDSATKSFKTNENVVLNWATDSYTLGIMNKMRF